MFRKSRVKTNAALQDVIVTSDSVKHRKKLSLPTLPATLKHPNKLVLVAIAAVVVVVGVPLLFALYLWIGGRGPEIVSKTVCNDAVIKDADAKIAAVDRAGVAKVGKKITALKRHETDPNCEFILVRSALIANDTTEARKQLAVLKKVYKGAYSSNFTIPTPSPDELAVIINDVEAGNRDSAAQSAQQNESNASMDSAADKTGPGGQ